jgi:hypothetical protein
MVSDKLAQLMLIHCPVSQSHIMNRPDDFFRAQNVKNSIG